jgi:hypothetical protein
MSISASYGDAPDRILGAVQYGEPIHVSLRLFAPWLQTAQENTADWDFALLCGFVSQEDSR